MNKETDKPADALLEALRQWHKRTTGKDLTNKELLAQATAVIKERINL